MALYPVIQYIRWPEASPLTSVGIQFAGYDAARYCCHSSQVANRVLAIDYAFD